MIASYYGLLDVVKTLIEAGANVNHTNKVGKYMRCCCIYVFYHRLVYPYMYAMGSIDIFGTIFSF